VDQAVLIVARRDFPPNDLKEFVAYVKANSDKLNMAHAGVGSITHFAGLLLNSVIGAKPAMIPFNGSAPAINALVAGQVDYMCDPVSDIVQQVEAGTMKVYATGTAVRNPALPNIPTAKEAGLPEFVVSAWYALFAPKGTPQPVLDTLTAALDKALDDDTVRKRLSDLGCEIPDKSRRGQAALASLVKSEVARWSTIIKAANVKGE
jgi:tripartite-type tricarboxylate transporter receptor subunit TctC